MNRQAALVRLNAIYANEPEKRGYFIAYLPDVTAEEYELWSGVVHTDAERVFVETTFARVVARGGADGAVAGPGPRSTAAAPSAAGLGVGSAAGAGGAITDPNTAYVEACVSPPIPGAMLLGGDVGVLRICLASPISQGLPLPRDVIQQLLATHPWLQQHLVPLHEGVTAPKELSLHVQSVLTEDLRGAVGGCSSEMYSAMNCHRLLERTLWLIAKHMKVTWLTTDRNVVDPSEATASQLRPDFLCWVNGALLFKGEEKAKEAEIHIAVKELQNKMSEAWVAGTVQAATDVRLPSMLAYAAAGSLLQFFAIVTAQPQAAGGGGGSVGGGARGVRVEPISVLLNLRKLDDRLTGLIAAFNIWRLLAGYAEMGAPAPSLPVGQTLKFDGCGVTMLPGVPGFVRKVIKNFRDHHKPFTTFEVLQHLYAALSKPQHKSAIIQAIHGGPRLRDGSYFVHLTPPGVPCAWPPGSEEELKGVVAGVLRGLAALQVEGFVHRDVRWRNVIYLPAEGRWLLIDLEHAGRTGCDCSKPPFPLQHWSGRTLAHDGTYGAASDLRMVSEQLMVSQEDEGPEQLRLPFTLGEAGRDLRRQLLEADEGRGLSAAAALAHVWLQ